MAHRCSVRVDNARFALNTTSLAGALGAALLLATSTASVAATYTETGDAGDLPATAQATSSSTVTPLTAINGTLTATNGISEADMFQINITNASAFSASTTGFVAGSNNFDSQLFLFKANGVGVAANDDAAAGGSQSAIPAGSVTTGTGLYYLFITGSGKYPTSSGGLIFPNYTDGTTDPSSTYGPSGPGGGTAITGYTGSSNEAGSYSIALNGAQAVNTPEPVTAIVAVGGLSVGLGLNRTRRRTPLKVV